MTSVMRFFLLVALLLASTSLCCQFHFKGKVPKAFANKEVYISLVEDYRKTSRVYLDQIIQKAMADSTGLFVFEGNQLSEENRIYRIHVDGCENGHEGQHHFLQECGNTESLLFIANNKDTLNLPLGDFDQAFCELLSTNPNGSDLLEVDALKEAMILDFMDYESDLGKTLNFGKWFKKLQTFGRETGEPLTELYVHDFLSDRRNETHVHYLESLKTSEHYDQLALRLSQTYPNATFTKQFQKELNADKNLALAEWKSLKFQPVYLVYLLIGLGCFFGIFHFSRKRSAKRNPFDSLTAQERKIMDAILDGKTNKEIAAEFFISLSTVKSHINSLYKKLHMGSREEILSYYKGKK